MSGLLFSIVKYGTITVAVLALAVGCAKHKTATESVAPPNASAALPDGVTPLASVDGVPITKLDLEQRIRQSGHGAKTARADDPAVLETVIDDELIYERGVELGLGSDSAYRRKVAEMEAQLATFKRREMASLVFSHEAKENSGVTDADARAFFDKNAERIRTALHVEQLMYKGDRSAATKALAEIRGGAAFEDVATKRFPTLPADRHPWDLGFLRWEQIPEPWEDVVYKLEPGQVSDLIEGDGERYWIVKLVEKRQDPAVSFEAAKARVVAVLQRTNAAARREKLIKDLRSHAKIVYTRKGR